jgi:hypothetical protein
VEADGIIATNHHVISGAKEATATFSNGEKAKVLGTLMMDPKRDIAIIKIEKSGLPTLNLAAELPRKGESVVACGAPRGLSFSYSEGIISAVRQGKELSEHDEEVMPGTWVQTTAPISPGNSGGPLVSRRTGEVVAANTLASLGGAAQNLNFSISSLDIADVLKKSKKKKLIALSDGAAKTKPARRKSKRVEVEAKDIPKEKIEQYVKKAQDSYKDALVDARRHVSDEREKLNGMKKGIIGTLALQAKGSGVKYVVIPVRGRATYQFPDQKTKTEAIKEQQDALNEASEFLKKIEDPETGILTYLSKEGPELDPKSVGELGCVKEIPVLQIMDVDEFRSFLDRLPVTIRGIKTQTLASGTKLPGRLMYVCGTESYLTQIGVVNAYVLREVPEDILSEHLVAMGVIKPSAARGGNKSTTVAGTSGRGTTKIDQSEFRIWTDKTGKHRFEAKLLDHTTDSVVLKGKDGRVLTVKLSSLSEDDVKHVKSLASE